MNIVNLTPHPITLIAGDESLIIQPSGTVARAAVTETDAGVLDVGGVKVPLVTEVLGDPVDLPAPQANTKFIVSRITAQAALDAGRPVNDLLIPSKFVRDADGNIIGCCALMVMTQ